MTTREERASLDAGVTLPEADAAPVSPASTPPSPDGRLGGTAGWVAIKSRLLSLLRDRSVRAVVVPFSVTRLLVLALLVLTPQVTTDPSISPHPGALVTTFTLHKWPVAHILRERASVADCWWFQNIAKEGYVRRPFTTDNQYNWAFFPLFPLMLRAAARVTGEMPLTGMVLCSILFFVALVLLHKLSIDFGLDEKDADRTTLYLTLFPFSYFFAIPLSESLFLVLTVGSFYAAKRDHWLWAGILGALASATRVTGVLLLPVLAILYWQKHRRIWPLRKEVLWLLLIPTGLLSFMVFLYFITGNAFAFKDIYTSWNRRFTFFFMPLFEYLRDPMLLAHYWDFRILNFLASILALVCGFFLLKWRWWSLAAYTLVSMFISLSSGVLQSHARYVMVLFPIFMVLAVAGRNPRVDRSIRAVSLFLFTIVTLFFSLHFDIALS